MTLDFSTAAGASVLVLADISRVQRKSADRNTLFRILVDGNVVMQTNTGAASMMGYHSVTLHAVAAGLAAGSIGSGEAGLQPRGFVQGPATCVLAGRGLQLHVHLECWQRDSEGGSSSSVGGPAQSLPRFFHHSKVVS